MGACAVRLPGKTRLSGQKANRNYCVSRSGLGMSLVRREEHRREGSNFVTAASWEAVQPAWVGASDQNARLFASCPLSKPVKTPTLSSADKAHATTVGGESGNKDRMEATHTFVGLNVLFLSRIESRVAGQI